MTDRDLSPYQVKVVPIPADVLPLVQVHNEHVPKLCGFYCPICSRDVSRLPKIAYQPGWRFEWEIHNDLLFIRITVGPPAANAFDSGTREPRTPPSFLWVYDGRTPLGLWVSHHIVEIEQHERHEWLKIDGKRLVDPHEGPPG